MKKVNYILTVTILITLGFVCFSCRKNPTAPMVTNFVFGPTVTIQQLRAQWATTPVSYKFPATNSILYAVVTADEVSGQLYKQVYVRDHSGTFAGTNNYGAISLHFLNSTNGALYQGDSIAINLNGCWLDLSGGGSLQIDSIPRAVFPVIKVLASGLKPAPLVATIPQINTYASIPGISGKQFVYDAQLVQINNAEFITPNLTTTFATPQSYSVNVTSVPPTNVNKYVTDFTNTIVAYNSGYSNFASQSIPNNSGSVIAVANLYTTMQLSIRSYPDVNFTSPYVSVVYDTISQYFGDPIHHPFTQMGLSKNSSCANMAGWQTFDLQGNLFWQGAQYGVFPDWGYCPSASNYKTNNVKNDLWLVSPRIVDANYAYGAGYTKKMDFSSAIGYGTPATLLSVWISNSFDGTNIIPSQWTNISTLSAAPFHNINQSFAPSNFQYAHNPALSSAPVFNPGLIPISLGSGITPKQYFYVAFRYQSNTAYADSTGSSYYLGALILKN